MLRNREIRIFLAILIGIAIVTTFVGFLIHPGAGFLALCSAVVYIVVFILFTKQRYKSLQKISEQIDLVLHKADHIYISDSAEGELSILQSEITKMTQRIREQNDKLLDEKKLLAESLADVAHQLRTPLTSVNLILSLLENTTDEAERASLLRETDTLLTQMDWLLTSLLKISRLDASLVAFTLAPVSLAELISRAAHPLLISMELHDIRLDIDVPNDLLLACDANWLAEALQNILKNCMESIGEHGEIDISCTDTMLFTELTIHDSGHGFMPEDLPHIFERFYRSKHSNATGYGIGLALSRMVIMRQGGTITAKNHPAGGALFIIRFPK